MRSRFESSSPQQQGHFFGGFGGFEFFGGLDAGSVGVGCGCDTGGGCGVGGCGVGGCGGGGGGGVGPGGEGTVDASRCVTVCVRPSTVMVPVRIRPLLLAILNVTTPSLLPSAWEVIVIHESWLSAVQLHPFAETVT